MAGNLLNIGKSGLFAAQAALATTGHNIANASVAGYSRQGVVQASLLGQNSGSGFIGNGTTVADIKRYTDSFLNGQVTSAQTSKSSLDTYYTQISQIDNLLADTTSGLSPALQDFFSSVQNLSGTTGSDSARQAMLSSASTMATRFQAIDGRLEELQAGVNSQITTNVNEINTYASQIAHLNEQISAYSASSGRQPNDLLDARDQLVMDLNTKIQTTVSKGENNSLTISIGNGQPLVVGKQAFGLAATTSDTDQSRVQVGVVTNGKVTTLAEDSLKGGSLGGLMAFRLETLDKTQNAIGRVAISLAATFNAQQKLGQDSTGAMGKDFFTQPEAFVGGSIKNNITSTTAVKAVVVDASALTQSDYKLEYDGTNFNLTRLSDNVKTRIDPYPQANAQRIDGIDFTVTGAAAAGDNFSIKPTVNGAANIALKLTDVSQIATATPITTSVPLTNTGTGRISSGTVDAAYLTPGNAITTPIKLTYDKTSGTMSGFPADKPVTVTTMAGAKTVYPAGATNIPFTAGASYNVSGMNVTLNGVPADQDTFTISKNTDASGDTRNAALLAGLQTKNILNGGTATYQSAYAQLVSFVGNKTREVKVNADAGATLLAQVTASQQDVSGVNLDEEAANLLKYQQAYQAAGKVMQIASTMFDTLLTLGR
ncbi:MAG TPA: flagellar hook-associated protein FlgK [Telluria sp.]